MFKNLKTQVNYPKSLKEKTNLNISQINRLCSVLIFGRMLRKLDTPGCLTNKAGRENEWKIF